MYAAGFCQCLSRSIGTLTFHRISDLGRLTQRLSQIDYGSVEYSPDATAVWESRVGWIPGTLSHERLHRRVAAVHCHMVPAQWCLSARTIFPLVKMGCLERTVARLGNVHDPAGYQPAVLCHDHLCRRIRRGMGKRPAQPYWLLACSGQWDGREARRKPIVHG